jgi:uncharacterized membrane protein YcaP (DUF421 family)
LALNYAVVRFLFAHPKFDELVEGKPTTLIEHGHMNHRRMQRELVTKQELQIAAHKQGFGKLEQIERAVLEPSGVLSFVGKEPPPAEVLRRDLVERLEAISRQLGEVQAALAGR